MIYSTLKSFLDSHPLLSNNQLGFREHKYIDLAIITLVDKVILALQQKSFAVCVFLDFTACFDTVDRDILSNKLYRYGKRGVALDIIKSYFLNRQQRIPIDKKISVVQVQTLGVFHG